MHLFAPLHDIGKIGIPDNILLKPGPVDPVERKVMESHVQKGADMVSSILGDFGLNHLPDAAIMRNIVYSHHEFLDGSGYPHRLRGDQITLASPTASFSGRVNGDTIEGTVTVNGNTSKWVANRAR